MDLSLFRISMTEDGPILFFYLQMDYDWNDRSSTDSF